jgi:hypothetical protein
VVEVVGDGDGEDVELSEVELDEDDGEDRDGAVKDKDVGVELGKPVNVDRLLSTSPE